MLNKFGYLVRCVQETKHRRQLFQQSRLQAEAKTATKGWFQARRRRGKRILVVQILHSDCQTVVFVVVVVVVVTVASQWLLLHHCFALIWLERAVSTDGNNNTSNTAVTMRPSPEKLPTVQKYSSGHAVQMSSGRDRSNLYAKVKLAAGAAVSEARFD
ncbi:hypothetical protein Tsp_08833 [Trichinella spiralis]|uniref:hypothetical protein n=1 Tax=Trichinella spiralis TaxID=6334 RepID=UPI0001EFE6BE|nr:hypothetical protein Tsp_08833 [Trichinella spiralis]